MWCVLINRAYLSVLNVSPLLTHQRDIFLSLLIKSIRWKGDPPGSSNAANGKLKGKDRKKRNMLHHHLEAGKIMEDSKMAGGRTRIMGKGNHLATTYKHKEVLTRE